MLKSVSLNKELLFFLPSAQKVRTGMWVHETHLHNAGFALLRVDEDDDQLLCGQSVGYCRAPLLFVLLQTSGIMLCKRELLHSAVIPQLQREREKQKAF